MMHFADHLLHHYGYGVITAGLAIECAGLLFPGETIFFGAAIYARYLFRTHGGKVVFFCRFVSVLRSFNAVLAGASAMPFRAFLAWTLVGGVVWPCAHGLFAYALGDAARRMSGPFQWALAVATVVLVAVVLRYVKRNELRLEEIAMRSEAYEHHV